MDETITQRLSALEKRMDASEDRERVESKEFVAVSTELRETKELVKGMDGKLDGALEYIAQQKGREHANKIFYSLGGGAISALVTYYLTRIGGQGGR